MITTTAQLVKKYDSPSGLVSYLLFQPEQTFSFLEGQFVMIEAEVHGKIMKKPYSLATTSLMLHHEKELGVVVKKTSDHGMSDFLTCTLNVGDSIIMKGPVGHYVDPQSSSKYLLISAGSGLSPNVALFRHLAYEHSTPVHIVHVFGERHYSHVVPYLESLFIHHGREHIHNFFYLSQDSSLPPGYRAGHVQDGIPEAIELLGTDLTAFVCGKPEMVIDVQKKLLDQGIPKEQIILEKY